MKFKNVENMYKNMTFMVKKNIFFLAPTHKPINIFQEMSEFIPGNLFLSCGNSILGQCGMFGPISQFGP